MLPSLSVEKTHPADATDSTTPTLSIQRPTAQPDTHRLTVPPAPSAQNPAIATHATASESRAAITTSPAAETPTLPTVVDQNAAAQSSSIDLPIAPAPPAIVDPTALFALFLKFMKENPSAGFVIRPKRERKVEVVSLRIIV